MVFRLSLRGFSGMAGYGNAESRSGEEMRMNGKKTRVGAYLCL